MIREGFLLSSAQIFSRPFFSLAKMMNGFQLLFLGLVEAQISVMQLQFIKAIFPSTFLCYTFVIQVCLIMHCLRKSQQLQGSKTAISASDKNVMCVSSLWLPCWLSGKESACQCRRCGFAPWVRKISWRRKWQPTPIFLPGKSYRQGSLEDYSSRGRKEPDPTE